MRKANDPLVAIVDDDDETTGILAEFLERRELRTRTFDSAEGIRDCRPQQFDAIILDINLPGMWGTECSYRLRRNGYEGPIIAITGNLEGWDEDDLYDLGFTCVLGKPFDPKELAACVKEHISAAGMT